MRVPYRFQCTHVGKAQDTAARALPAGTATAASLLWSCLVSDVIAQECMSHSSSSALQPARQLVGRPAWPACFPGDSSRTCSSCMTASADPQQHHAHPSVVPIIVFSKNLGNVHPRLACAAKTASDLACLLIQPKQHQGLFPVVSGLATRQSARPQHPSCCCTGRKEPSCSHAAAACAASGSKEGH